MSDTEGTTPAPNDATPGTLAVLDRLNPVEMTVLELLAGVHRRMGEHTNQLWGELRGALPEDDWRLAFIDDANDILILVGRVETRLARLERKLSERVS